MQPDRPETKARLWIVDPEGRVSPLASCGEFRPDDHVLASLTAETRPLLDRALRTHREASGRDKLTLLVSPRPLPEITRSADIITAFLASGPWAQALVAGDECSSVELCYRALALVMDCERTSIALNVVHQGQAFEPPAAAGNATIDLIIPHRGSDRHLRVSLASLARQTCQFRTLLCFDQEPEPGLIAQLPPMPGLELFQVTPNPAGPYVPRQHFALTSDARYVAFQDSDDFSLPCRLETLAGCADVTGVDIVGSHEVRIDETLRMVAAIRYPLDVNRALSIGDGSVQLFPSTLVRTDLLKRLGGFSTNRAYAADRHFQLRAFWRARIVNLDSFLYVRRRRAESLSTSASTGMDSDERRRINRLWDEAFERAKSVGSAEAEPALDLEPAQDQFRIRDLRAGTVNPAVLRPLSDLQDD